MNRIILVLNVIVLVVNFMLALSATDTQLIIARSSARTQSVRPMRHSDEGALAVYTRVLQSLETIAPPEIKTRLSPAKLRVIYDAVEEYHGSIHRGVQEMLWGTSAGADMRSAYRDLCAEARKTMLHTLAEAFTHGKFVDQLANVIVKGQP